MASDPVQTEAEHSARLKDDEILRLTKERDRLKRLYSASHIDCRKKLQDIIEYIDLKVYCSESADINPTFLGSLRFKIQDTIMSIERQLYNGLGPAETADGVQVTLDYQSVEECIRNPAAIDHDSDTTLPKSTSGSEFGSKEIIPEVQQPELVSPADPPLPATASQQLFEFDRKAMKDKSSRTVPRPYDSSSYSEGESHRTARSRPITLGSELPHSKPPGHPKKRHSHTIPQKKKRRPSCTPLPPHSEETEQSQSEETELQKKFQELRERDQPKRSLQAIAMLEGKISFRSRSDSTSSDETLTENVN